METWKDIKGYEGLYQVSNTGKVKSVSMSIMRALYENRTAFMVKR